MNRAIAVLYARQLLIELCAHWPKETADRPMTMLAVLGCSDEQYLPFVLDLLCTEQLNNKLQPVRLCYGIYTAVYLYVGCLIRTSWLHYSVNICFNTVAVHR